MPSLPSLIEDQVHAPSAPAHTQKFLAPAPSVLLDIVRFLAALTVAVGHLSQTFFTTGWPPMLMTFAQGAVAVFFVLSGFMIRYITTVKYGSLRAYAVDRFARIYSVLLPALALTILLDVISYHLQPAYYVANFTDAARLGHLNAPLAGNLFAEAGTRGFLRILMNLTLLSQSWFRDSAPLSNVPFWSLSYECVYYSLFGITLYLRGIARVAGWVVTFLLIGPTIFLMYPLWLLGCAAYDWYREGTLTRPVLRNLAVLILLSLAGVHGSRVILAHLHLNWFYAGRLVPFMDYVAIATVAILTPLCIALRYVTLSEQHPSIRVIRRVAAATFPLYLIHVPIYVLFTAAFPSLRASLPARLTVLAVAIALSLILAAPCERFKNYLRRKLLPLRPPAGGDRALPLIAAAKSV